MPTRVRAARLVAHGAPLVVEEVGLADPGPGQVRVEMAFAGVNPVDRYAAAGLVAPDAPLPRTLGGEGSGFLDGQAVAVRGQGLWASAVLVDQGQVVALPDGVPAEQAAALGVAGVTAWRTVTEVARVTPSDRVLVLGASGGVGSMVISLVRSIGAEAWGQTGSEAKAPRIGANGASRVVVAADAPALFPAVADLRPTVVFDPLGGEFTGAAVRALSEHGRLVLFGTSSGTEGTVPLQLLYRKGISVLGYAGLIADPGALSRGLEAALRAVAEGRMRVHVDAVVPLADVNGALERLASRAVDGKLVLDLRS